MADRILSAEEVAAMVWAVEDEGGIDHDQFHALARSHEALRAALEEAVRQEPQP